MVKLKKLHIKNLQSVKDCTIEFDETGVYHLAGKHNIGKSAIVKAINALFRNVSRFQYKYYLRDNEKTFSVSGEFWDGSVITLSRGENDYYEWKLPQSEGTLSKTDGKVPDEIKKYLNLYIDEEKTNECLNVRTPRSVLLFVDTTQGDNYFLFQKALRTEEFILATRLANRKKNQISANIKQVNEYKDQQEVSYNKAINLFKKKQEEYSNIEKLYKSVESKIKNYKEMEQFVQIAYEVQELNKQLSLDNMDDIVFEKLDTLGKNIKLLNVLHDYLNIEKELNSYQIELDELNKVIDLSNQLNHSSTLLNKLNTYITTDKQVTQLSRDIEEIDNTVNVYEDTRTKLELLNKLKDYQVTHNLVNKLEKEVNTFTEIEDKFNNIPMNVFKKLEDIMKQTIQYTKLRKAYKSSYIEYKQSDKDMTDFMREYNYCPIVAMTLDKVCPFGEGK